MGEGEEGDGGRREEGGGGRTFFCHSLRSCGEGIGKGRLKRGGGGKERMRLRCSR